MIQREVGSSVIVKRCVTEQGESITSWKVHCALPSKPTAIRSVYVVQSARSSHWSVLTLHRKDPMGWMYEGNNGRTDRSSHAHHVHQHKVWKYWETEKNCLWWTNSHIFCSRKFLSVYYSWCPLEKTRLFCAFFGLLSMHSKTTPQKNNIILFVPTAERGYEEICSRMRLVFVF